MRRLQRTFHIVQAVRILHPAAPVHVRDLHAEVDRLLPKLPLEYEHV